MAVMIMQLNGKLMGGKDAKIAILGHFGLMGCHQARAVLFASLPFLRALLRLDALSLGPHYIISGFSQSSESKGSPGVPNSFLSLPIIIGCLSATQG